MTGGDVGAADAELAREIAAEAGRRLLDLRAAAGSVRRGPGGGPGGGAAALGDPALRDAGLRDAGLRDAGDRLSHEYITAELARRRPQDAVLSEEGPDSGSGNRAAGPGRCGAASRPGAPREPARLSADRVWIVDPLDGTREFGEPGRTDWAVHVALWERRHAAPGAGGGLETGAPAGELTAGAVALPAQGVTLSTIGPVPDPADGPPGGHDGASGAARGGANRAAGPAGAGAGGDGGVPRPLRIVVSRTRPPAVAQRLPALLGGSAGAGAELVPLGSAGAKVAAVLAGDADAYVHSGGFYEWDTAAPVAVARAAGFHASRIDGGPLRYNQANTWMPDILVCPPALAGTLLEAIAAARSGHAPDIG